MPIFGVTVSEQGDVMQRLAVTTKVAIGEVVKTNNGKTYPQKLDHFVFLRKSSKLEWEPDPDLIKHYTGTCREFWIILLDDQIENVFRTEYAWWSAAEKKCWGDGRIATRRTEKNPDGEEWSPCGETCPDLDEGRCKPSGDLYFIMADFPRLGSVCRLHTTSYRSIRQIYSALEQIRTVTGGRLAGIRCKLVVRPEKSSFLDPKDKKKKSTTIYALNIELSAADMRSLIGNMTEHAKLFEQTRRLLGDGRKVEMIEDEPEVERAVDVAQEFYPAEEIAAAEPVREVQQPSRASAPVEVQSTKTDECISPEQRRDLYKICVEEGWSNDQVKSILRERWQVDSSVNIPANKYVDICMFFRRDAVEVPYKATDEDIPF